MNIWKFVCGYVKINIMGHYPERIVNNAASVGIPVSCVKRLPSGEISCLIPMRSFVALRTCARGTGCRVHITAKYGLPCVRSLIRQRITLAAAALAVLILIASASTRLIALDVNCEGDDRAEILQCLDAAGIHIGMPLRNVVPSEIVSVLNSVPGLKKAEVEKRGVVLCVNVLSYENASSLDNEPYGSAPLGIYASKNCVISSISVEKGRPLAAVGDRVSEGQLLITGDYNDLKPGYTVNAEGVVYGRVLYRINASAERYKTVLSRTGECCRFSTVVVFGRELLAAQPYEYSELEPLTVQTIDSSPVPVFVNGYICFELAPVTADIGEDAALLIAEKAAQDKLFGSIPKDSRLISVKTEFSVENDGSVTATVTAVSIESIGCRREIID